MKLSPMGEYQNNWLELECLIRKLVQKPKENFTYFPPLIDDVQKLGVLEYQTCTDIMVHYTYYLTKKEPNRNKLQELKALVNILKQSNENIYRVMAENYA